MGIGISRQAVAAMPPQMQTQALVVQQSNVVAAPGSEQEDAFEPAGIALSRFNAKDAVHSAWGQKRAIGAAAGGVALAVVGTAAVVAAAPVAAPVIAVIGVVGACAALAALVFGLGTGSYFSGRQLDYAAAKMQAAKELAVLIRRVTDEERDSAADLLGSLIDADAGAEFFADNAKQSAVIAERRAVLETQARWKLRPHFLSLSDAEQRGVLQLLCAQNMVHIRSFRSQAIDYANKLPFRSMGALLLTSAIERWDEGRPNSYVQRVAVVDALYAGSIGAGQKTALCRDLMGLAKMGSLPLTSIATLVGGIAGGLPLFVGLMQAAGHFSILATMQRSGKMANATSAERGQAIHDYLKLSSKAAVEALPPAFQARVNLLDNHDIPCAISQGQEKVVRALLMRRQGILLSGGTEVIKLGTGDSAFTNIMQGVDEIVKVYSAKDKKFLKDMVRRIVYNSIEQRPNTRAQYYLHGPPGVGKSHFVRELASTLKLPLFEVNADQEGKLELTADKGFGNGDFASEKITDESLVGSLAFAMLKTGVKNPIIFIDEAGALLGGTNDPMERFRHQAAIEGLKKVLLQENKTIGLHALGPELKLDFSHATIIFAGNCEMDDAALRERVLPMRFPDMNPANKRSILDRKLDALVATLSSDRRAAIRACAEAHCPLIMELDEAAAQPGARKMQEVAQSLVEQLRFDHAIGNPYEAEVIARYVRDLYITERV